MEMFRSISRRRLALFALIATLGGFVNGLLGAGGGILMIFAISFITKHNVVDKDKKDVFANSLASMIPICFISSFIYFKNGAFEGVSVAQYLVPALIGGIIGALALDKLKFKYLNIIFAAIVIYSGFSMLLR